MDCRSPATIGSVAFPCGRCIPCRVRKKRTWQNRLALETLVHAETAFVTLTYNDENLPEDGNVSPREVQLWLKKLRKRVTGRTIRFFAVGEYGGQSFRPHYHAILYGMPGCVRGQSRLRFPGDRECGCYSCNVVRDTWGKGHTSIGTVTLQSAGYIAGYTIKKMTSKDDPRLNGHHPEFARMSLKPGIGVPALSLIVESLVKTGWDKRLGDVPHGYMMGKTIYPYGRYLKRNLRKLLGRDENTPPEVLAEFQAQLWDLYVNSRSSEKSFAKLVAEASAGNASLVEARSQLYRKTESI